MVSALVLVNSNLDSQDRVIESLRQVDGLKKHMLCMVFIILFSESMLSPYIRLEKLLN